MLYSLDLYLPGDNGLIFNKGKLFPAGFTEVLSLNDDQLIFVAVIFLQFTTDDDLLIYINVYNTLKKSFFLILL